MEKELANWIYYEDGDLFYCSDCIDKRLSEINMNKEFSNGINYESGDKCGYFTDYADTGGSNQAECCICEKQLLTIGFD